MKPDDNGPRKVLITGAAGYLGAVLAQALAGRYALRLVDRRRPAPPAGVEAVCLDIRNQELMQRVCAGCDTVVHLAAEAHINASWGHVLSDNIWGTAAVFQAAHEAGCRRVLFASSLHAVGGFDAQQPVPADAAPNPVSHYGFSKAWGEALASYYASQFNLSIHCLRLGWVMSLENPSPWARQRHRPWILTEGDFVRLVRAAIEAPEAVRFGVFNGVSNNRVQALDIASSRQALGYRPQDDAFDMALPPFSRFATWMEATPARRAAAARLKAILKTK